MMHFLNTLGTKETKRGSRITKSHRVVDVSLSFFLSFFRSFCLSVFLSFCLSVFPSFCLSVFPSFCLSVFLSFRLSVFLSFCLSVFLSFCLSFSSYVCKYVYKHIMGKFLVLQGCHLVRSGDLDQIFETYGRFINKSLWANYTYTVRNQGS